jgi:hypothetical protein
MHREHIIRLAVGGPDTYPNLVPICTTCNLGMGKNVMCTFDYMMKIGRMSAEQASIELKMHSTVVLELILVAKQV